MNFNGAENVSNDLGMKVQSIQVTAVLSQYDHSIEFADGNNFVIIYGPNGVGKTKFLEVVDAISDLQWSSLLRMPFGTATITYANGATLMASRVLEVPMEGDETETILNFELAVPGKEVATWKISGQETTRFENWLQRETSWSPIGSRLWRDQSDGEIAEGAELEVRFRNARVHGGGSKRPKAPEALEMFAGNLKTHLIETQRLRLEEYRDNQVRNHPGERRVSSTIVEYAGGMQRLLSNALAENSRITQQLDRTFPSRMLAQRSPTSSETDIRQKYELQDKFRSRLAQIALIGLEPELSLPERQLEPFEILMLDLYLKDADNKLESFEGLLSKIELLEQVVNSRLLGKKLHVNAQDGLAIRRDVDNVPIALDKLSSGEQHELILMYGLLFNVEPGTLVLIDEPEISLHVSWQIKFISDVQKISKLADFQFVVATHSPQIINDWWAFAKRLGPADADF